MFTKQELIKQWANDDKRREFLENYKVWGIWFMQPELDQTYFKYDLADGTRIVVVEYVRPPRMYSRWGDSKEPKCGVQYHYQQSAHFDPAVSSTGFIAEKLKNLKIQMQKDAKTGSTLLTVPYVSVWDGGTEVTTSAVVDIITGEVSEIKVAQVDGLDICEREYITINDEHVNVYHDERGYDNWADLRNEYGG